MSGQDSNASLIALFSNIRSGDYAGTAAAVILPYDYCLTFIQEIELFWKSAWTGAAVLFFMNRYITLTFKIYAFMSFAPIFTSDSSCRVGNRINTVFDMMQYIPWAGFSALRAYAMSRNRAVSVLIGALYLVPNIVNGIRMPHLGGALIPGIGCIGSDSSERTPTLARVIASRVSLILADILVVLITRVTLRVPATPSSGKFHLMHTFKRDGTIYFICMAVLNILHLLFTMLSIARKTGQVSSVITTFTEPITAILVSRCMLNLQAAHRKTLHLDSNLGTSGSSSGASDTLVFHRVVGSLGASAVDHTRSDESEGDDEHRHSVEMQ